MLTAMDKVPPVSGFDRGLPSTKGAYLLVIRILLIMFYALEKISRDTRRRS